MERKPIGAFSLTPTWINGVGLMVAEKPLHDTNYTNW